MNDLLVEVVNFETKIASIAHRRVQHKGCLLKLQKVDFYMSVVDGVLHVSIDTHYINKNGVSNYTKIHFRFSANLKYLKELGTQNSNITSEMLKAYETELIEFRRT